MMDEVLTLQNELLACLLRPDLGGSIQSLIYRAVPVLRTPPAIIHGVRDMGSFPLVPFSNRVARAQLQWQGTDHPLIKMGTDEEHAIHGVAWQRPWTVLEASDDLVMMCYEHQADSAWPFAFDVSQTFKLSGDTLSMTLSITNQAPSLAPVGLGWHPYFAKREQAHLAFTATARWEMSPSKLPTHQTPSTGLNQTVGSLDVDHCFDGWSGVVDLVDERLHTRIESNMPRLVVYTQPAKDCIAIEPVSHVNNAVNAAAAHDALRALGIELLDSGATYSRYMTIQIKDAR
ncbi:MAG: aldose 1-epimerase [Cytophagales bacterium]|nr:aldose 1-epimerase [Cytophagales bacterium]